MVGELVFGGMGDVMAERLREELVRGREVFLAMPEQHARARIERGARCLGDQRGLAQARFTRDEQHLASFAVRDALERIRHRRHLDLASDHADRGPYSQTSGQRDAGRGICRADWLPQQLDRLDGIRQALQDQFAERAVFVTATPTSHPPHHVCCKDLSALATGTQPCRFDHRVAEVVVVFSTDLTDTQPDPQPHLLFTVPVVPFDALLHRHRARQRGRRGTEHHHEPVTQVLYLGAARLRERLTQNRDMLAADLVSGFGRHTRRQLRRTDHVREQHGDVLSRHRTAIPARTSIP